MISPMEMDYQKTLLSAPEEGDTEKARIAKELEAKNIFKKLPRGMAPLIQLMQLTAKY